MFLLWNWISWNTCYDRNSLFSSSFLTFAGLPSYRESSYRIRVSYSLLTFCGCCLIIFIYFSVLLGFIAVIYIIPIFYDRYKDLLKPEMIPVYYAKCNYIVNYEIIPISCVLLGTLKDFIFAKPVTFIVRSIMFYSFIAMFYACFEHYSLLIHDINIGDFFLFMDSGQENNDPSQNLLDNGNNLPNSNDGGQNNGQGSNIILDINNNNDETNNNNIAPINFGYGWIRGVRVADTIYDRELWSSTIYHFDNLLDAFDTRNWYFHLMLEDAPDWYTEQVYSLMGNPGSESLGGGDAILNPYEEWGERVMSQTAYLSPEHSPGKYDNIPFDNGSTLRDVPGFLRRDCYLCRTIVNLVFQSRMQGRWGRVYVHLDCGHYNTNFVPCHGCSPILSRLPEWSTAFGNSTGDLYNTNDMPDILRP